MISVVIPAYNEGGAIRETVEEARSVLTGAGYADPEIIIVNDGSSDDTAAEAERAGAKVLTNPHNMGYGFSLKRGIAAAKNELIVITDADRTYPFGSVIPMLERKKEGFDLVVGARTGENYRESALKMLLRRVLRAFVEFVAGRRIPDINSGLRVFDRSTVMPFFPRLCNTFSFSTSQTLAYMMTAKFVCYVDIPYNARKGKSHVRMLRDSLKTMQYITEAAVYYNPLKIFVLITLGMLLLALIGGIVRLATGSAGGMLFTAALTGAVTAFCFGLLAVLLKQIMDRDGKGGA